MLGAMSVRNLKALFRPNSVAVIGADTRPGALGTVVMRNLLQAEFPGPVMPVTPDHTAVSGVLAYADAAHLPIAADLALICSPASQVAETMAALGAKGTRATCIMTPGLQSVILADGRNALDAAMAVADSFQMRVLGPNSLGIIVPSIGLNASFAQSNAAPGKIAFVSQSAALCTAVLDWASSKGIGFSHFIHTGDRGGVGFGDILDYLGSDASTRAILLFVESLNERRNFMSAARAAARNKPVLMIKAGRSAEGARAAFSHTGQLAGSDMVFDAAIRRAGMLRVNDIEELFGAVENLARSRPFKGDRLAILTNGGGIGVIAADDLADGGGRLAEIAPATIETLNAFLPSTWSRLNPIDIGGHADGERYGRTLDTLMACKAIDAILVMHAPNALSCPNAAAQAVIKAWQANPRAALMTCWVGGEMVSEARRMFAAAAIPAFETPRAAISGFLRLLEYRRNQDLLMEVPPSIPDGFAADAETARAIIAAALDQGRRELDEAEAQAVLAAYGIASAGPDHPPLAVELSLRVATDPIFGPVIALGDGITSAVGLPPLNLALAADLVSRTGARRLLADAGALHLALAQVSQMVVDLRQVVGMDIDSLLCRPDGVWTGKARIRLDADVPAHGRMAIRPYPRELEERFTLADGEVVLLRPIRPEDEPNHHVFISKLTPEDIRFRFFGLVHELPHSEMARLTQIDYDREMAFIAERETGEGGRETLGVVRTITDSDNDSAEFAIVVRSDIKASGLGKRLLLKMIDYCRSRGTRAMVGQVLRDNHRMLGFVEHLGFRRVRMVEDDVVEVELLMTSGLMNT